MQWLVEYYKNDWPFDTVIVDELSSFKNHNSKRFKALKLVRPLIKRIIGLTGTPAPNRIYRFMGTDLFVRPGRTIGKNNNKIQRRLFYTRQKKCNANIHIQAKR